MRRMVHGLYHHSLLNFYYETNNLVHQIQKRQSRRLRGKGEGMVERGEWRDGNGQKEDRNLSENSFSSPPVEFLIYLINQRE
jgi:hypothetical protein